jgi:inorganic pyrophosphatase
MDAEAELEIELDASVPVYIEIEKGSLTKYEFNKHKNELVIDRMMPPTHPYPFAYGFFPNTLADDGDDLDAIILRNGDDIKHNTTYKAYIIGMLVMEDEKGMDEKVLCVLDDDYATVRDIDQVDNTTKTTIHNFFSTYKQNVPEKWSRVYGFLDKDASIKLYYKSLIV